MKNKSNLKELKPKKEKLKTSKVKSKEVESKKETLEKPEKLKETVAFNIQTKLSHKVLTKRGYILNKKNLTKHTLEKIKKDLVVSPKAMDYGEQVKPFEVFKEDAEFICLPRFYGVDNFGAEIKQIGLTGKKVDFKFNGEARDFQKPVIEKTIDVLKNRGGGILKLYCGFGKTVVAIMIASKLKVKTLILVHKSSLQSQWYDRIKSFTDAKVGIIRQDKIDVEEKDIVVGMLQSISMKDYDLSIFNDFGLVVCDECFTYNTKIKTEKEVMKIGKLYEIYDLKKDFKVLSYSQNRRCFEYQKVTQVSTSHKKTLKLFFNNESYESTWDHKFLTLDGYQPAYSLLNKEIVSETGYRCINDTGRQILYALILKKSVSIQTTSSGGFFEIDFRFKRKGNCFDTSCTIDNCDDYLTWLLDIFGSHYIKNKGGITEKIYFKDVDRVILNGKIDKCRVIDCLNIIGLSFVLHQFLIDYNENGKTNKVSEAYLFFLNRRQLQSFSKRLEKEGVRNFCREDSQGYLRIVLEEDKKKSTAMLAEYFPKCKQYLFDSTLGFCSKNNPRGLSKIDPFENYRVKFVKKIVLGTKIKQVYDIEVENNNNFVLDNGVVVHNCHHFASRVFSQALYKVGSKAMLGLSATPYRNDGLTKVLNWYIGNIICDIERKGDKRVVVKFIECYFEDKYYVEKKRWMKGIGVKPNVPIMINSIVKVENRNIFITDCIEALIQQDERKILVLSDRIEHLEHLKSMLDKKIIDLEKKEELEKGEITTSLYIGRMKSYELEDAQKADVLFASYAIASEGLDIPDLNALILVTSKADVIQCVGRILRKQLKGGDLPPVIIDLSDQYSVFERQGNKRKDYYKKKNYTIDEYCCYNGKLVSKIDFIEATCDESYAELFREAMSEDDIKVPSLRQALEDSVLD